jgi:hypothetical protein
MPHPSLAKTAELPELPPPDETITSLSAPVRDAIGSFWHMRAELELTAMGLFADVARGLFDTRAEPEILWVASRALTDEIRHSLLCHHVADVYFGRPAPEVVPDKVDPPRFGDAPPEVNRLLHLITNCCINETIASAQLRSMMKAAVNPLVREVTRLLLADEIDHARVGWAVLGSPRLSPELRWHVGKALPALLRLAERVWLGDRPVFTVPVPVGHGYLPDAEAVEVTFDALDSLVFPGLARVGVDVTLGQEFWKKRRVEIAAALA